MSDSCKCSGGTKLVFACSGAADVGALADQAARKLTRDGSGKMFCLAGIGGRVGGIMETAKAAQVILAIDGCPLNCAKKCLQEAGFSEIRHLQLADIGMLKGKTDVNESNINTAAAKGASILQE